MRIFLSFLLILSCGPAFADYVLRQNKDYIVRLVEQISFVDEAFFHDALLDEDIGDDLGVFFDKDFGEKETKEFFKNKADTICKVVYRDAGHKGGMDVYFYQRTLIRKYNEEGWATCKYYRKEDKMRVVVHSRIERYGQSAVKWIGKGF